jgi:hypothetical protein
MAEKLPGEPPELAGASKGVAVGPDAARKSCFRGLQGRLGSPGAGPDGAQDARRPDLVWRCGQRPHRLLEDGDFMTELALEVLEGAELADLQSLFADEMQVSPSSLGYPADAIPVQVPVATQSWEEWTLMHRAGRNIKSERSSRRSSGAQPGQLSLWSTAKEGQ